MLNKLLTIFAALIMSNAFLFSAIKYELHDIGTLQTYSSHAIAINNGGQILGWYNLDGTQGGKHFFVRDRNGTFNEIDNTWNIDWKYLTDTGNAYGKDERVGQFGALYVWDAKNGVVNLGDLPGSEISAINNAGQVLIKSISDVDQAGNLIRYPVIWENGNVTKLRGPEGDLGIESTESYGFDMNNIGDVVGYSVVDKEEKVHATKWINGQAIDMYNMYKIDLKYMNNSDGPGIRVIGFAINDQGDILLNGFGGGGSFYSRQWLRKNNGSYKDIIDPITKITNKGRLYSDSFLQGSTSVRLINDKLKNDRESLEKTVREFMNFTRFTDVNDNDELIGYGTTFYGEQHAMLLIPVKSE